MATSADCPLCQKLTGLRNVPADDVVWEFPRSVAFLGPWQYYRGYCVLVSRQHAAELFELDQEERRGYLDEMCLLARAIGDCFRPWKLNYELLGNQVPHLHWHIFPRSREDPDRLQPVWLAIDRAERHEAERERLRGGATPRAETAAAIRVRRQEMAGPGRGSAE